MFSFNFFPLPLFTSPLLSYYLIYNLLELSHLLWSLVVSSSFLLPGLIPPLLASFSPFPLSHLFTPSCSTFHLVSSPPTLIFCPLIYSCPPFYLLFSSAHFSSFLISSPTTSCVPLASHFIFLPPSLSHLISFCFICSSPILSCFILVSSHLIYNPFIVLLSSTSLHISHFISKNKKGGNRCDS